VRRWSGPGEGNRAGRAGGVLAVLCVSYLLAALCVSYPRGVERLGLIGRRNWVAKRKKRVQKGVQKGYMYVGVLLRGSRRRGGRRHSHIMNLSCNNWLRMIVMIQQLLLPLSLLESYSDFPGNSKMTFFHKLNAFFDFFKFFHELVCLFL